MSRPQPRCLSCREPHSEPHSYVCYCRSRLRCRQDLPPAGAGPGLTTPCGRLSPQVWHHSFYQALCIAPEQHPLLVTEPPSNPTSSKEKMSQARGWVLGGRAREGSGSGPLLSLGMPSGRPLSAGGEADRGQICPL